MRIKYLLAAIMIFALHRLHGQEKPIVLKGGTLIDVENYGQSAHDITNAVIVIQHGKIMAAGANGKVKVPANATIINASGKFIVPGLIEGFGSVTSQAFANAYLYMGVTSVVTVEDNRRGKTFTNASPSPGLYKQDAYWGADRVEVTNKPNRFENINYRNDAAIRHEIDSMAKEGARVMLVHYGVKKEQLPAIIAACKAHHIPMIGELGFTSYRDAVNAGIKSFVHTSRYSADILPDSVRRIYSNAPFGPPATYYYTYLQEDDLLADPKLAALAKLFASHPVGLMPTGSLLAYPYMPFHKNPWLEPAASLISEKDILHEPLDRLTGKQVNPPPYREKVAPLLMRIDSFFVHKGVHYLAGSGATAFGTMPGISLHTELQILSHAGLTNRQVLACATNNYSLLWDWKHTGKIEAGRDADILILSANPLESVDNLKAIDILILKGKTIDRSALLKK